eukprot:CAMPEP_0177793426 /NCGR_PEP_ID=MMETSP0491_2-20121128/25067_1 /TAXON_ID=63592 /ORGANISM="Tetraselmis chuii, Strain PLY429" /LENGTH=356 /DNA_ID=CAMNT_0019315937 /DNA_START=236 /DNA_END=1306 /DNA_ORIENTATION=-
MANSSKPAQRQAKFSSFAHPASDLFRYIDARPFVAKCQLLAACTSDPSSDVELMNGTSWLPDSFEDWSFSRAKGKLTDMTALQQAHPDNIYTVTDNSLQASTSRCDEVAIVPGSGGVQLCLVQESYAQFGLTGVKRGDRYIVSLTPKQLQNPKVQRMLQNVLSDIRVLAVSADGMAMRAAEMEQLKHEEAETLKHATCHLEMEEVAMIQGMSGWGRDCLSAEDCGYLHDWLGALSCAAACAIHDGSDGHQASVGWNSMQPPYSGEGGVACHQWDGLMAPVQVRAVLEAGRSLLKRGLAQWVCISSFQAPTHYRANPGPGKDGKKSEQQPPCSDEGIFIVLLPDDQYIHLTCASEEF